jgi:hypothetical protein
MKKELRIAAVSCFTLSLGALPALADEFHDAATLYRDVNAANPGLEVIAPLRIFSGPNAYLPVAVNYRFNVFRAGTTSPLYSSSGLTLSLPRPCANPDWFDEREPLVVALPGSTRTHLAQRFSIGCSTQSYAVVRLYSADVATAGGSVWTRTYNGLDLDALQGVDTNGDGTLDALMLRMHLDAYPGSSYNYVTILNQSTGAIISSQRYEKKRYVP